MKDKMRELLRVGAGYPSDLHSPEWDGRGKVHNWRNHVPIEIQINWQALSDDEKLLVWFVCEESATREEWE